MKKIACLILSLIIMLSASACSVIVKNNGEDMSDYPVTVGNVVFEKTPEKVAVLSDNLADIILACGYERKLAARSDACRQEELSVLPSVGTPDNPDIDKISQLGIELVLGDESFDEDVKNSVNELGIKTLIIKPAVNDRELNKLYGNIAAILGGGYNGRMRAMDTLNSLESELNAIRNEIVDKNILSTACYIYELSDDQCRVACGNEISSRLFEYAEVKNIAADDADGYIGIDTLLKGNPETIFCDAGVSEKLAANNDLSSLTAVSEGRIFQLPKRYLSLQGQTQLLTIDYIAAKTHGFYTSRQKWPEDFVQLKITPNEEYTAPFEPQIGIFYTVGESYNAVLDIEKRLVSLGYMTEEPDKFYTQETADAVIQFQTVNGLLETGIADYDTLTVLLSKDAVSMPTE